MALKIIHKSFYTFGPVAIHTHFVINLWEKGKLFSGCTCHLSFHSMATANLKKVRTWWQISPQHQSTYQGGPKSAWIEILPFRRFLWSKFSKIFGSLQIFFCFTIHKKLNKSCSLENFFLFLKKKIVSLKKTLKKNFVSGTHRGGFQFSVILTP